MLHVKVFPIGRLPKQLAELDYTVPTELEDLVAVGQLIRIPLRNSEVFGVIFLLEKKSETDQSLKSIMGIVDPVPIFSALFLRRLQTLAGWYGVSISTLVKMSVLPLQKRKLKSITLNPLPAVVAAPAGVRGENQYIQYQDQTQHKQLLGQTLRSTTGQTLLLVPEITLVDEVLALLPEEMQDQTVVWHGDLSDKEKFSRWLQIRNGEKKCIIGTRSAIWLPFFDLQSVIVDYEHHREFKHSDQNPRFHVKDVVEFLRAESSLPVHFLSFSLSSESYLAAHKQGVVTQKTAPSDRHRSVSLLDMRSERTRRNYGPLSFTTDQALRHLHNDAFFFVQRRGSATGLGCLDCGFLSRCPTCQNPCIYHEDDQQLHCHYCRTKVPVPATCPQCRSTLLRMTGAGTQLLETTIRGLLGGQSQHQVLRIDGDVNDENYHHDTGQPRVVIGTEKALPYIRWDKTDLIVCVDIDRQLSSPEFLAGENVWHFLAHLNFYRHTSSSLLIQTRSPEHPLFQSLADPESFYRRELNTRHRFVYPPHCYLVRYLCGHENAAMAEKEVNRVYQILQTVLTTAHKSIKVLSPMPLHPLSYRGKYWYGIIVKMSPKTWQTDLSWLNQYIPGGNWRIDPHPNNLLAM